MRSNRVLMIAYHYPPVMRSSGVHRAASFARYLPEFGWEPTVLTVQPRAYEECDPGFSQDLPGVTVKRAFALDAARHLSVKGRYLKATAIPDRWLSWLFGAVPAGLALIRHQRPDVIWSTYPIATAHLIGHALHKMTGIPWVADFRDPMTGDGVGYEQGTVTHRVYEWIERRAMELSSRAVFVTPEACKTYREKFSQLPETHSAVVANGFDEEVFLSIEKDLSASKLGGPRNEGLLLVHSGALYRCGRDPEAFFRALSSLRQAGRIGSGDLRVILRASGNEPYFQERIQALQIEDIVRLAPAIPYREALAEILLADGLLLFQGSTFNRQIPAKIYEYLRARRPILAFADQEGDTAQFLRDSGVGAIASLEDEGEIAGLLIQFLGAVTAGDAQTASDSVIASHSRKHRTLELARILESAIPSP